MRNTTREQIYNLIDGERDYQDKLGPDRTDGGTRTVGDYITMMTYYVTTMHAEWTKNPGDEQALNVMRKCAGIAVHCMEDYIGKVPAR